MLPQVSNKIVIFEDQIWDFETVAKNTYQSIEEFFSNFVPRPLYVCDYR